MMSLRFITLLFTLLFLALTAIDKDLMANGVPGYASTFKERVWSGYLNTGSSSRKLHYVFIQSSNKAANTSVTLWLNGGPGCSSLLGFLQQIGPFYLQQGIKYKVGDNLTQNPYSWHKISHLLFIQSPAGVGYSLNSDDKFQYTDISTANDNFDALTNFFVGFPQYSKNPFWMAGESYAGKYIPDLAVLIDYSNQGSSSKKINLKGIFVGNGIMSFEGAQLQKSQIQYMINHEFIDIDLLPYYRGSCLIDPLSAGCRYFKTRYRENIDEINPYNVYSYCFYNDSFMAEQSTIKNNNRQSQSSILNNIIKNNGTYDQGFNSPTCAYFDGLYDYFNAHVKEYHGVDGLSWNGPCASNISSKYMITSGGSMEEYRYLLNKLKDYQIVLYNGDWDDVVPYTDTYKNLEKLNLKESNMYQPFFANDQHAGFIQVFNGLSFAIVKGASHQVPQSKRAESYVLFDTFVNSGAGQYNPTAS